MLTSHVANLQEDDELRAVADLGTIQIEFRFGTVLTKLQEYENLALPRQSRVIKEEEADETKSLRIEPGTTFNIQKPKFYGAETDPEAFTTLSGSIVPGMTLK